MVQQIDAHTTRVVLEEKEEFEQRQLAHQGLQQGHVQLDGSDLTGVHTWALVTPKYQNHENFVLMNTAATSTQPDAAVRALSGAGNLERLR